MILDVTFLSFFFCFIFLFLGLAMCELCIATFNIGSVQSWFSDWLGHLHLARYITVIHDDVASRHTNNHGWSCYTTQYWTPLSRQVLPCGQIVYSIIATIEERFQTLRQNQYSIYLLSNEPQTIFPFCWESILAEELNFLSNWSLKLLPSNRRSRRVSSYQWDFIIKNRSK